MLNESWTAKIGDFGTSRLAEIVQVREKQNQNLELELDNSLMTGRVGTTR